MIGIYQTKCLRAEVEQLNGRWVLKICLGIGGLLHQDKKFYRGPQGTSETTRNCNVFLEGKKGIDKNKIAEICLAIGSDPAKNDWLDEIQGRDFCCQFSERRSGDNVYDQIEAFLGADGNFVRNVPAREAFFAAVAAEPVTIEAPPRAAARVAAQPPAAAAQAQPEAQSESGDIPF